MDMMANGLAPKTVGSYGGKLDKFLSFCASRGLTAVPATTDTALLYLAHLASLGTIAADNIQPYMSCINTAHTALGLPPPAFLQGPAAWQWSLLLGHFFMVTFIAPSTFPR